MPPRPHIRLGRATVLVGVGVALLAGLAFLAVLLADTRSGLGPAGERVEERADGLVVALDAAPAARAERVLAASGGPARLVRRGEVVAQTGSDETWGSGGAPFPAGLAAVGAGWSVGDGYVSAERALADGSRLETRGRVSAGATSLSPALWIGLGAALLLGAVAGLALSRVDAARRRAQVTADARAADAEALARQHVVARDAGIEVLAATVTPLPLPVAAATGSGRVVRNDALVALTDDLPAADAAAVDGAVARALASRGLVSDRIELTGGVALAVEGWGVPEARVVALVDRTEQARLAELRRRISAGAARRLRAPLSELHTLAAEMNATAPAAQAVLAGRMLAIVDRLRGLTRAMVRGTEHDPAPPVRPERIGVSGLLWGMARRDEDRLRASGVRIEIEVADDTPAIWADLTRLQDVLGALVANAERFTPVGGTITLWASAGREGRVLVGIRDTGPGVGPAELRAVFEPFVRGADPAGRPGDGLGLSGARALTERLGGTLRIEPGRDGGPRLDMPAAPVELRSGERRALTGSGASP